MDATQKMFQTLVNGQSAMKSELLTKIEQVRKEVQTFKEETDKNFKKVNKRLDTIGKSVAYLEDDAPTIQEFDDLEERVSKLEKSSNSN